MNNFLRDFFHFRKSDRRAVVALGCIAVFCIGVMLIVDALENREKNDAANAARYMSRKEAIIKEIQQLQREKKHRKRNTKYKERSVYNDYPVKASNKSRFKGGGSVYGRTEKMSQYQSTKYRTLTQVDANTADSATLCRIPGIGAGISNAILRYRTHLGGFYSTQQLLEINIFSPELLEWFTISDTSTITKISINQASFQVLNSHPYINYEQTRNILRYIRLYGNIPNEQTLLSTGIFTEKDIERLRAYIVY